jgi:hypothetical protein
MKNFWKQEVLSSDLRRLSVVVRRAMNEKKELSLCLFGMNKARSPSFIDVRNRL